MRFPLTLLALSTLCAGAPAGPIDPPAGPVQSTMRSLDHVEPRTAVNAANTPGDDDATPSLFRISAPGSYYLTGNITGVAGRSGIEIASDGVTLDLGGFIVEGVPGALSGIQAASGIADLTITNGVVRAWPGAGLSCGSALRAGRFVGVTAAQNSGFGFVVPHDSVLEACTARGNGEMGFLLGRGTTAIRCTSAENSSSGFSGSEGVHFSECTATDNDSSGIIAGAGSVVRSCTASRNGYKGIYISAGNAATGGVIEGCAAFSNGATGIHAGYGSLVSACTAASNGDDGILATSSSTVSGCTVYSNSGDGIEAQNECTIVGNQIRGHYNSGQAGIYAWSSGCRIEQNNLASNAYGLRVTGTDNFIARNTARGNSSGNYSVVSGNELAPVITNPGSNSFSTMTPWSNVAF